ncbi:MAG: Asp-tRNA(Asn)/Glu-tRNA(Gln) amidotransferase subunit GatA [Candidatus Paceibacterota bacterium]
MSLIKEIHQKLIKREISVEELIKEKLELIEEKDKKLKAFLTVEKEKALEQAKELDKELKEKKEVNLLFGIPYAVKDNILTKGVKTTAGSKILENYIAPYDATVIKKLKEKKAVLIGKTNLDEFAMGSSTENSAFQVTKNPYDLERVPGGSSGGSAVAVAEEMSIFSLGSDTGGSIRQPAAFCGVVGFKPSYGTVSRYGLIAMASSLDVIGPFGKTVEDVKIVFEAIQGKDEFDSTSYNLELISGEKKELIVGIPKECFNEGVDFEIKDKIKQFLARIEKENIKVKEINLKLSEYALACYYIIMPAEVSANLARYDGLRYSPLNLEAADLLELYFQNRGKGFGNEVKRRILLGTYVLSRGYYEAFYKKAQKVRKLIQQEYQRAFEEVDFIINPTTPTLPFKIGERTSDPLSMYLSDIFTVGANISGIPAINLPIGFSQNHLPIGVQISAPYRFDFQLLEFAQKLEKIFV